MSTAQASKGTVTRRLTESGVSRGRCRGRQPSRPSGTTTQSQETSLPQVRPFTSHVDSKEVEKLDSWFEGASQPSQRIQELMRRKRHKHASLVRQLRQELFRERSAVERTVAFISDNLRTELDKASLMVKLKGQELSETCAAAVSEGDPHAFKDALRVAGEVVLQLTGQRKRTVDALYDLLLGVEAEHQTRARAALRKHAADLAHNGHLPPHRLQPILDAERKEVSEFHLRHVISFGDLRLCLNAHADQDCRRFKEGVENTRRLCREKCQRTLLNALQEAGNKSVDDYISSSAVGSEYVDNLEKQMTDFRTISYWSESYPFSEEIVGSWEKRLNNQLEQMDTVAEKISAVLKVTLGQLQDFATNEVERIKRFLSVSDLCSDENFQHIYKNVCLPLLVNIETKTNEEPASFKDSWKQVHAFLASQIDSFSCMLRDAGILWAHHCKFQESERQKIVQNLHEKKQAKAKYFEAKEQRIAAIVEKSREETSEKILKENVARIFRILDEVQSSYENMNKTERETMEEYKSSNIAVELDSLSSSIQLFVKNHKCTNVQMNIAMNSTRIINVCEETIMCLGNQRTRCYQDIAIFLDEKYKEIVQQNGQNWVKGQLMKLEEEFSEILDNHRLRYDKIRSQVEFTRLRDIKEQGKLLESHKKEIFEISSNIQKALDEAIVQEFQLFKEFSSYIRLQQEMGLKDTSLQSLKNTISQVEISYAQCKESVRSINKEFQTMSLKQMQKMSDSNSDYLRSLRLVADGGTFAESDVRNVKSEIAALELETEENVRKNVLLLKERSKECCSVAMKHVNACLRDLQLHSKDLMFTHDVTSQVQRTQTQLRKHVLALKYGGKLLKEQNAELSRICAEEGSTADITSKWRCVLKTVSKQQKCLLSEDVYESISNDTVNSKLKELVEHRENQNFLQLIFKLLKKSLHNIQLTAEQGFHNKETFCALENPSYKEVKSFMSGIISKYKLYQQQCIEVWISELIDLLEVIQKLQCNHTTYCERIMNNTYEDFSKCLKEEKSKLNNDLTNLRTNYQQYQLDAMAKLTLTHKIPESQWMYSSLCAEFEKTSELLSKNIKNLVDKYMTTERQCLQKYENNLHEQRSFIGDMTEQLFGKELTTLFIQRIERELEHLNKFYSLEFPSYEEAFPCIIGMKKNQADERVHCVCPSEALQGVNCLVKSVNEYLARNKQKPASFALMDVGQSNLEAAKALVNTQTCEVKHLYEQYKSMAEELRMKWRITLNNIQQLYIPV